jgi:cobalamin biosynthesis Mg chelatase CobN
VLALLALAVVPVFAHAGGIPTYETEKTESFTVPTKKPQTKQQTPEHEESNNAPAEGSKAETKPGDETGGEGKKESEDSKATTSPGKNDGNGGHGGEKNAEPGKGTATKTESGKVGEQQDLGGNSTGTPAASKSSSDGSSSPLVPILIVVVVLAAISIGVVLYRQRKSSGAGPDGRVSSPNAS